MPPILTSSQKVASALRRAEKALRNWQDDPDSPRSDVDKMLLIVADLREWVQGHVLNDVDSAHSSHGRAFSPPPAVAESSESYDHAPRDEESTRE